MIKFLNSQSKTIVGAAFIVGALSLVSRIVGLVRDRILAGEFGAGEVLDIYYAAFKIPDLMYALIVVGALSASFIPLFTKYYYSREKEKKAWKMTNNVLHLILAAMLVFSFLILVFAKPVAGLVAPGFELAKQLEVAKFMQVMVLAQILLSVSMVYGSVLQGMKRFFLYSLAPILYNFGIIVGAVVFVDHLGPIGLAWGVVFGALLHLLVQIFGVVKSGYRYKFAFSLRDKDIQELMKMMGPRVLGIGISQIQIVILTIIGTTLAVGSVTEFTFAYNIQFFPVGIIGVAYAIAVFPTFSELLEKKKDEEFVRVFSNTVRQVLFIMVPMTVIFLLVRAEIVRVVVGAGLFDWDATVRTANILAFFSFSFVAQSLVFILSRAFFALHDTWTPFATGLASTVLGVVSALWLTEHYGVLGLGLAFSLASIVNAGLLWVTLRQRIGTLGEASMIRSVYKIITAGAVSGVALYYVEPWMISLIGLETFFQVLITGFLSGLIAILIYLVVALLLRSEELTVIVAGIKRRFIKAYQPEETVSTESTT